VQAAELAQLEDVNPKVLRYLGYSAYENQQFQESKDALEKLFTRMEEDRVIPRDYLHLGLADIKLARQHKHTQEALFREGITPLENAVAAHSAIADDLHDVGMDILRDKNFLEASKVFHIPAATPECRNFIYDDVYPGYAAYYALATNPVA